MKMKIYEMIVKFFAAKVFNFFFHSGQSQLSSKITTHSKPKLLKNLKKKKILYKVIMISIKLGIFRID